MNLIIGLSAALLAVLSVVFVGMNYLHLVGYLLYFSVAVLSTMGGVLVMTPVMIYVATKTRQMDFPDPRKMHKTPVPLLGGVAIYVSFIGTALFYQPWPQEFMSVIAGATILLVVGTVDDMCPLSSTVRLIAQLAASLIVMSSGLSVSFLPATALGGLIGGLITLIWIIGITNAFNFSDGVDGLASGIAVIAATFFLLITIRSGQFHVALLAAWLMGCGLGFLCFNFKPARIYLGDGGSTMLGFLLACIALYGGWSDKGLIFALGIPALILGVLIFDMCYITISRVRNGLVCNIREWLDFTGKDHFHHRLLHLGFQEEHAVIFIYVVCTVLGLSALVVAEAVSSFSVVILLFQAHLVFVNITLIMLVGRRLYVPHHDNEKRREEEGSDAVVGFIPVSRLERVLEPAAETLSSSA